ncbi:hypothetical protein [Alteribacillus sp. HJP-4]
MREERREVKEIKRKVELNELAQERKLREFLFIQQLRNMEIKKKLGGFQ